MPRFSGDRDGGGRYGRSRGVHEESIADLTQQAMNTLEYNEAGKFRATRLNGTLE